MATITTTPDQLERAARQLKLPHFEGHRVSKIKIALSGSIELDIADERDTDLFAKLQLGSPFQLIVSDEGEHIGTLHTIVTARPHEITLDDDGYIDETISTAKLKLTGYTRPADPNQTSLEDDE